MNFPVLDMTAGGRMMWFDKNDPLALFLDKRCEDHPLSNGQHLVIRPDSIGDFRDLPFQDSSFHLVVFDPPHLNRLGKDSWTALKYGALLPSWREDLKAGFEEAFRVLKPHGTLVFKWNSYQIPTSEVLALTPHSPLFGHTSGKQAKTHWLVFMKGAHQS